jgi:hypothetical protein
MSTATETAMTTWERFQAGLEARSDEERQPCLDFALSQPSQAGVQGGVGEYRRKSLRNAALKRAKRAEGRAA